MRKHSERGPVGDQVAENLARLRRETTAELAAAVTKLGVPMTASTITKIETQKRRITVDELVALAAALGVSPVTLMLPPEGDQTETVRLAERLTVPGWREAWRWMHGLTPLVARKRVPVSGLSWLATNRPYVTEEELAKIMFAAPATIAVEVLEEEVDDGPGS
ncbi:MULTISPECIES: helix-turn-helix domain-containing protein [Streptomyces]|nr:MULTISPECIES: helix-turn-helix transcriptional regulator [Streptomyces]MBA8975547.1 transcriptional regulator with XRE-family HTH domain [Streptomyces calvus]